MRPQLYSATRVLAAPSQRATSDEARMIDRLATKAVALAEEYGIVLTHKDALQRVRLNLAHVRGMAADTGVREEEWLP